MKNYDIEKIIKEFLNDASDEELAEFYKLLERRKDQGIIGPKINVDAMAHSMAKQIKDQMGVTDRNIKVMARDVVASLILQNMPNIPKDKLKKLISMFVPREKKKELPAELVFTMTEQYITFSIGMMSDEDMHGLPHDWHTRYWNIFPESIQKLIIGYLKGSINKKQCMDAIRYVLNNEPQA